MKQGLTSSILEAGDNLTTHNTVDIIGESVERSTKVRYLGGHLDSNLPFKEHMLIKCKAASLKIIKV